tara:strand:+ start:134 stop:517 length:384 start_codon:yes stop_codon:yes gene_type:complete
MRTMKFSSISSIGEYIMKTRMALIPLMLLGISTAKNLESRAPIQKKEFNLTYYDLRNSILSEIPKEGIIVEFTINEQGKVENPVIKEEYDIRLSETIIDKVLMLDFKPALQNGRPVRIRYKLPIMFK